jgi:outer membrane immunogenic protein
MRKIVFGIALALTVVVQGNAADLPTYQPLVPFVPAVYNWTGIYLGVNAGYGFAQATETANNNFGFSLSSTENLSGGVGGIHFGGNYQTGSFVFGLEVDGTASGQKNTATIGAFLPITIEDKVTWLTTARLRVGGAIDRVLLYGTAGGAYGELTSTVTVPFFGSASASTQRAGGVVGAGVEYAFTAGLIGRLEYLYLRSADQTNTFFGVSVSNHLSDNIVRAGLSYKFGP